MNRIGENEQADLPDPEPSHSNLLSHCLWLVRRHPVEFWCDFDIWLLENIGIYKLFEAQSLRVVATGRTHYGAARITEWLRHETGMAEASGEFKINNNYRADMARLFGMRYPQHAGLFAVRERTSRRIGLPA